MPIVHMLSVRALLKSVGCSSSPTLVMHERPVGENCSHVERSCIVEVSRLHLLLHLHHVWTITYSELSRYEASMDCYSRLIALCFATSSCINEHLLKVVRMLSVRAMLKSMDFYHPRCRKHVWITACFRRFMYSRHNHQHNLNIPSFQTAPNVWNWCFMRFIHVLFSCRCSRQSHSDV